MSLVTLPVVTIEDIRSWDPCDDPVSHFGLPEDWQGNALDLLDAKGNEALGDDERLWGVLRIEMLPEPLLSEVVVATVKETPLPDGRAVNDLLTNPKSRDALDARLKWCRGEVTDEQLDAARVAARDAAGAAIWSAAQAAAWGATREAAQASAQTAAWHAALTAAWIAGREVGRDAAEIAGRAAQVKIAKRVIQEAAK